MHTPFLGLGSDTARRAEELVVSMAITRFLRGDRHLLVQQRYVEANYWGAWELPQGHVKPGESLVQAATRETAEETGLRFTMANTPAPETIQGSLVEAVPVLCVVATSGDLNHFSLCLQGSADGQEREVFSPESGALQWVPEGRIGSLLSDGVVYPLNVPMMRAWLMQARE